MNKLRRAAGALGVRRGDLVLAAALLVISMAGCLILFLPETGREYVSVRKNGEEIALLPLDTDCAFSVGDGNIIEIKDGTVRMTYADCPDKICVRTGSISHSGQSIVCAPNKVVILIVGGNQKNQSSYDVITN
jgi:Uncharacterized protein conserved in bacteria